MQFVRSAGIVILVLCAVVWSNSSAQADEAPKWSGIFVGAGAGWLGTQTDVYLEQAAPGQIKNYEADNGQPIVSLHLGAQHQFDNIVVGIEGSVGYLPDNDYVTGSPNSGCPNSAFTCQFRLNDPLVMVGAKLGWVTDNWLLSASGGWAHATLQERTYRTSTGIVDGGAKAAHDGWYMGAGVERMVAENWILGLDYTHIDLGEKRHYDEFSSNYGDISMTSDTVQARLTYRIGSF